MAGTAILKNLKKTANLNITQHTTPANTRRCLCLEQPKVVEQNNDNNKHRLMNENLTNYCSNSSYKLNRILKNNYNIKTQTQQYQQRPSTLSLVIIMSLTIILIQMPTMVKGKAISREVRLDLTLAADAAPSSSSSSSQASADESELLLLSSETYEELEENKPKVDISSSSDDNSDSLPSLDVLKHFQRNQQHQTESRTRLRKRHINGLVIRKYLNENSHNIEWKNPCNGAYQNNQLGSSHVPKQVVFHYLKKFRDIVKSEHISTELATNVINIADISTTWAKHKGSYSFLPKLNSNGNITLSRWYRNMQIYVASFGYLARTQYKFDMKYQISDGETSEELDKLLVNARHILCELEVAINGSTPNSNVKKVKTISYAAMNKRLQSFKTKEEVLKYGIHYANALDLKYAKYSYFKYLSNMQTILNRKLRRKSKKLALSGESGENQSSVSVFGDDSSSVNSNSMIKSDSSPSLAESFEILMKSQQNKRKIQNKKSAELPQM